MGRTRLTRECPPPRAASALCPAAAQSAAAVGPDTAADAVVEVPETRRTALHGHG
ncbi:hypothetical protein AB0D66_22645 [Streptomyces sp. NPDC048270]|uniref:hypothetical protein n=1 Tax=Streptomyces sp. NPDC048270 TaxID=3154615 RepID=UPI0033C714D8